jgi:hypothetical protein
LTFAEIADGLAPIDVSGGDPEWREVWGELVETIRRAAQHSLCVTASRWKKARQTPGLFASASAAKPSA